MPKVGSSSSGSSSRPAPLPTEEEPGFFSRLGGEISDLASGIPRAAARAVAAPFADLAQLVETIAPGGSPGFRDEYKGPPPDGFLADLGFEGLAGVVAGAKQNSAVVREIAAPVVESLGTSIGQGFSGITEKVAKGTGYDRLLGGIEAVTDEGSRLHKAAEQARDLTLESPFRVMGRGEVADRIAEIDEMREDQILFPVLEDVGNVFIGAGALGRGASVVGRVSGSTRLSNIGASAAATRRAGAAGAREAFASQGVPISQTGIRLGQVARPIRAVAEGTELGARAASSVTATRAQAVTRLQKVLDEVDPADLSQASKSKARVAEAVQRLIDPDIADAKRLLGATKIAKRKSLSDIRQSFDPDVLEADMRKRVVKVESILTPEELPRVKQAYAKIAKERGLSPDLPTGRSKKVSDKQLLGVLDAVTEAGARLRKDTSDLERVSGVELLDATTELLRAHLYDRVGGYEGGITNAIRSVLELDDFAYTLGEAREVLRDALDPEQFEKVMSFGGDALDGVRLIEQTLPNALDSEGRLALNRAAAAMRRYASGIERSRSEAGLLPDARGSRLDPETGEALPGDAPTVFDATVPAARTNRLIERQEVRISRIQRGLDRLDAMIEARGGIDNLALMENLAKERAEVYKDVFGLLSETRRIVQEGGDPAAMDAALALMDELVDIGRAIDIKVTGQEARASLRAKEDALRTSVREMRDAVQKRQEEIAAGGTPFDQMKNDLRTLSRLARNLKETNAIENLSAMEQALADVRRRADELGINVTPVLDRVNSAMADVDRVRNQNLTMQQRLAELATAGIPDTQNIQFGPDGTITNLDEWLSGILGAEDLGSRAVLPATGFEAEVGKQRRVRQPRKGDPEIAPGIRKGKPLFKVEDFGEVDPETGRRTRTTPEGLPPEPIQYVYRAVSEAEWQSIQRRGFLQSDERGNIAEFEGTNAAVDPKNASSYLPKDRDGRVIKIRVEDADEWFTISADTYLRTKNRVPLDRIEQFSPALRPTPGPRGLTTGYRLADNKTVDAFRHPAMRTPRAYAGEVELAPISFVEPLAEFFRDIDPELRDDIAQNGIKEALIIEVGQDGTAALTEGNHRLRAARDLGIRQVPVRIVRVENRSAGGTAPNPKELTSGFDSEGDRFDIKSAAEEYIENLHNSGDLDTLDVDGAEVAQELLDSLDEGFEEPFYHGSVEGMEPGDIITPSGGPRRQVESDPDLAYSTRDPSDAAYYAELAASDAEPMVYEVRAIDHPFEDPNIEAGVPGTNRGDLANRYGYVVVRAIPLEEVRQAGRPVRSVRPDDSFPFVGARKAADMSARMDRYAFPRQGQYAPSNPPPSTVFPELADLYADAGADQTFLNTGKYSSTVQSVILETIREIGTDQKAIKNFVDRVADRLRWTGVANQQAVKDYLRAQFATPEGRALREDMPKNLPGIRKKSLQTLTSTVSELIRLIEVEDEVGVAMKRLREAETDLRRERNSYLKSSAFSSAVKRATTTLDQRARIESHVDKAALRLEEIKQEYFNSAAAVPRAGRTLVTAAQQVFPEVAAALRTMDDPVAARLADTLDAGPRTFDDLADLEITDAVTGEKRGTMVTYQPDVAEKRRHTTFENLGDTLTDETPGFTKRQRVSNRPQIEDPFELARRQLSTTMTARMQDALVRDFTEGFTATAESVLLKSGRTPEDLEGMTSATRARLMKDLGYVAYQPNDYFRTFRSQPFSTDTTRWVKQELASAMEHYTRDKTPGAASSLFNTFLTEAYDPAISAWKGSVLALRPLWQINNHIGNFALATFAGKVSVPDYFKFMATAIDLQRRAKMGTLDGDLRLLKPSAVVRSARDKVLDSDVVKVMELDDVAGLQDVFESSLLAGDVRNFGRSSVVEHLEGKIEGSHTGRAIEKFRGVVQASYRINGAVDDMNRALVYVARGLQGVDGQMRPDFDATSAVRAVNHAFGSYSKLSPFEQRVLRRAFPFYTWTRHISGVMWRALTDVNEIDRTLLFAHVVNIMGEPNEEEALLPDWADSRIFTGYNEAGVPQFINPRGGDPFSEGLVPLQSLGSLREFAAFAARSSGPLGGPLYESVTGQDVLSGTPLSGIEGPRGEAPTPGAQQIISEAFPQLGLVRDALREVNDKYTTRADDDSIIPIPVDPLSQQTTADKFMRYMGFVWHSTPLPVRQIEADRQEDIRNRQREIERNRQNAGGGVLEEITGAFRSILGRS